MPIVNSKESLKEYCLRKLGAPVMKINVDDDQVEDRISDALDMFFEYHSDGLVKKYLAIQLNATDIGNKKIPIPEDVYSIIKIFPFSSNSSASFNLSYSAAMSDIMDSLRSDNLRGESASGGGLFRYFLVEQNLTLINSFFAREKFIRFNRYQNYLQVDTNWDEMVDGDYIVLECWAAIDMETYERTWGNAWLKSYATSLIKQQWGMNMIKYAGFQLPSGIELNGRQIYDDATQEIAALEDELRNTWQLPCDFFLG